jgi:hypothetical protein
MVCQDDAPELETLSFNGRVSEKAGAGIILLIKNGYHSQKGIKLTHAYKLWMKIDLNQLSFGKWINPEPVR